MGAYPTGHHKDPRRTECLFDTTFLPEGAPSEPRYVPHRACLHSNVRHEQRNNLITGCEFCKSFEPLAVVGENSYTRGQCIQNARAKSQPTASFSPRHCLCWFGQ
jgi:hypothetical protein